MTEKDAVKGRHIIGAVRTEIREDLKVQYEKGASLRVLVEATGRSYGFVHRFFGRGRCEDASAWRKHASRRDDREHGQSPVSRRARGVLMQRSSRGSVANGMVVAGGDRARTGPALPARGGRRPEGKDGYAACITRCPAATPHDRRRGSTPVSRAVVRDVVAGS
jgi:hypothetical protein